MWQWCKTGRHLWTNAEDAQRCCNGWVEVLIPVEETLRAEGTWPAEGSQDRERLLGCSIVTLLPETEKTRILHYRSCHPVERPEVSDEMPWMRWNM